MYCSKCGNRLNNTARFCNRCGEAVKMDTGTDSHSRQVNSQSAVSHSNDHAALDISSGQQKPKRTNMIIIPIAAIIAIIIIAAILSNEFGIGGVNDSSPRDPAKITISQMKSDVLNVGASSNYNNLFFYQVDSFDEFAVAKTVVNDDKDKVNYHVDYLVSNGYLVERGIMLANDYTEGRIVIQYYKKADNTWVFDGFIIG